ncbi:MAG: DUF438 domain-containing protein [Calditrichaeota bacterium]|nr:DUF438 domain-containing protein [Calditrichota bacterium]
MPNPISPLSLTPNTKVGDLIEAYPFLIEELGNFNPHYLALRDPAMRQMNAPSATLEMAAMRGGVPVDEMIQFIAATIQKHTGRVMMMDSPATSGVSPMRLEAFRKIMLELHAGGDVTYAQQRFAELVKQSLPGEIAEMEQHLIREGVPVSDIMHMCDAHLQVVNPSLQKVELGMPAGHPVHSFVSENRLIDLTLSHLRAIMGTANGKVDPRTSPEAWKELLTYLEKLSEIDKHYLRKEHQLFSYLERYGFTGPSTVMWATHDDLRAKLKAVRQAAAANDAEFVAANLPSVLHAVGTMIQKEESILLPTALRLLKEEDWIAIYRAEHEIGYMHSFIPGTDWEHAKRAVPTAATISGDGLLEMNVGALSLEQVNLILTHLPVELSYVDEHDTVRFYSNQPHKIFARTPDAIGRKVQNCHPPKSVHLVNQILSDFRNGVRNVAEFWIPFNEMFVHIRYFAVRDAKGAYRGSLEVVQDVSGIRKLEGERRLLEEEKS